MLTDKQIEKITNTNNPIGLADIKRVTSVNKKRTGYQDLIQILLARETYIKERLRLYEKIIDEERTINLNHNKLSVQQYRYLMKFCNDCPICNKERKKLEGGE